MKYVCVNGHDRCYGGTSAGPECPYCERRQSRYPKKKMIPDYSKDTISDADLNRKIFGIPYEVEYSYLLRIELFLKDYYSRYPFEDTMLMVEQWVEYNGIMYDWMPHKMWWDPWWQMDDFYGCSKPEIK